MKLIESWPSTFFLTYLFCEHRIQTKWTTVVLGISIILFKSTLYKALGEHISVLLWAGHFDGSAFVKKCPGGITLNRLEAGGADCGSIEADRLYTIA